MMDFQPVLPPTALAAMSITLQHLQPQCTPMRASKVVLVPRPARPLAKMSRLDHLNPAIDVMDCDSPSLRHGTSLAKPSLAATVSVGPHNRPTRGVQVPGGAEISPRATSGKPGRASAEPTDLLPSRTWPQRTGKLWRSPSKPPLGGRGGCLRAVCLTSRE